MVDRKRNGGFFPLTDRQAVVELAVEQLGPDFISGKSRYDGVRKQDFDEAKSTEE